MGRKGEEFLSLYVGGTFIDFVHVVLKRGDASPSVGKECLVLPYIKMIGFAFRSFTLF